MQCGDFSAPSIQHSNKEFHITLDVSPDMFALSRDHPIDSTGMTWR